MAANSSSPLRYPYTLITESTDYLQIDVVEYVPIKNANNNSMYLLQEVEEIKM